MAEKIKYYLVGGAVRDQFLGLKSKDLDYTVEASSYEAMRDDIASKGTIFLENPEYLTIRAKINNQASDYVLARKDGVYHDGRRPESVTPGLLIDDLQRRDFTMNAMALDENGELVDPFNGLEDVKNGVIRCVGNPIDRFNEDSLRMLRAIRFSITKGFVINAEERMIIRKYSHLITSVSSERIREELHKCFKHNTLNTIKVLNLYPTLRDIVLTDCNIWLKPTSEQPT